MQLCIDIGNSRTKWGVFVERKLIAEDTSAGLTEELIQHLLNTYEISSAIFSSVKDDNLLNTGFTITKLSAASPLPFKVRYKTPETLGTDRLALVAGARAKFPQQTVLVISAGTCITYDLINDRDEYLGGSIHPGLHMRLQAMHTFTGKLPLVDPEVPTGLIGTSTTSSLQIGAVTGTAMEMSGMIAAYKKQFGPIKTIMTGGDAGIFVPLLENEIFALPLLSLYGLNEILLYNAAFR